MNCSNSVAIEAVKRLTEVTGYRPPHAAGTLLHKYLDLITSWNSFSGLISPQDLESRLMEHVLDSLGMVPEILGYGVENIVVMDIGTGAGFPIIPIKIVIPQLEVILVERSSKKAAFLLKVRGSLGLEHTSVLQESYPEAAEGFSPSLLTCRAIEKPESLFRQISSRLSPGSVLLCQLSLPPGLVEDPPKGVVIESVVDNWGLAGLRRGTLYRVFLRDSLAEG